MHLHLHRKLIPALHPGYSTVVPTETTLTVPTITTHNEDDGQQDTEVGICESDFKNLQVST